MTNASFPYKAAIFDLDGTLLNAEHKLGDLTINTLKQCTNLGVDIFIATGRNYPDVYKMVKKLAIDDVVLVTSNGARADFLNGKKVLHHYIEPNIAKALFQTPFDTTKVYLNSYQGDDWFINQPVPEWQQYFAESGYSYKLTDFNTQHTQAVEKIFFIAKDVENPIGLAPVEAYVTQHFADVVQITHSMPNCFELMAKGVNKGKTLSELTAMRGYALSDCIAFGDGMNDIEMLQSVGKGCVMANADKKVKDTLPTLEVIGNHKQEAVAQYLQNLLAKTQY